MSTSERRITFNESFREANRTRARYRILYGGAGSGKSFNVAQDFILKLSDTRYRGANLLVIRKTESACRFSVFEELSGAVRRIFGDRADEFWTVTKEPLSMTSLVTGSRIAFRGMKDDSQRERVKSVAFQSGKLTWIWCEEATELTPSDLDILDDRLRGDLRAVNPSLYYQITLTFNPVSANHFLKKRFFDAPPSEDVFIRHSTYETNAFSDADFKKRMERREKEDPAGYAVYALGEWGSAREGLILTKWQVANVEKDVGFYDSAWMAQDFGYNHANCLLLVGLRDGVFYILRELYVRERDTAEVIEMAKTAGFPQNLPMYCDSAEPDRIRMWRKAGFRAEGVKKEPGSILGQIEYLKQREIVIDASAENVISEIREWRWQVDGESGEVLDVPAPGRDDAMAALRYATEPLRHPRGQKRTISKRMLGI